MFLLNHSVSTCFCWTTLYIHRFSYRYLDRDLDSDKDRQRDRKKTVRLTGAHVSFRRGRCLMNSQGLEQLWSMSSKERSYTLLSPTEPRPHRSTTTVLRSSPRQGQDHTDQQPPFSFVFRLAVDTCHYVSLYSNLVLTCRLAFIISQAVSLECSRNYE